jgi:polyhydroxybutyrate depolymerase
MTLRLRVLIVAAHLGAAVASGCGGRAPASAPGGNGGGGIPGNGIASPGGAGVGGNGPVPGNAPPPVTCSGKSPQPADATWTLTVGGLQRTVNVHVPASYDPGRGTPLVLNFHGYTSNAMQEQLLSDMSTRADAAGFIVMYPEGTGTPESWNAGACCGQAASGSTDDLGFVDALLAQADAQLCVDDKRIFATGMSNGGFLSHRLGCERADRFAAIAPVAGVMGMPSCSPARPIPVMHFHGTADPLVPWNGDAALGFIPVLDSWSGWALRDGCSGDAVETFRMMDAHCATYAECAGGVEVTLCTVDNGGHTWPGGLPVPSLGYTTPYLNATEAMWEFFSKHPLP